MKKTLLLVVATLTLAVLASACSPTSTVSINEQIRTINVTGTGSVDLEPDLARVNIGVRSQSPDVAEALAENSASAESIIRSLMDMGIEQADIQTRNFNIYPQQEQRPLPEQEEKPTQTFVVENIVAVVVRDLDSLGDVLATVVEEGANTIHGVTFDIEDREAAIEEARQLAIEDAQAQAEAIAEGVGVNLGQIQSINIGQNGAMLRVEFAMEEAVGGGVPIAEGTLTIRMTANIRYLID